MLKALLLDLDETLCDTSAANEQAKKMMAGDIENQFGQHVNGDSFAKDYVAGIYRDWTKTQQERYVPIIQQQSEEAFRVQLIQDLLAERNLTTISNEQAQGLQEKFDRDRLNAFDFFPGIEEFLTQARNQFTLVVITNGPEFSQIPKVERATLSERVDHIIIGGQEPEQKPARSIFKKALTLANCKAHEAMHIGDSLTADIAGANNSGIPSVWIQHNQTLDDATGIQPDYTLAHPRDIPAFIKNIL